jgi:hypothetical protein
MIYIINRASDLGNKRPCEEAKKKSFIYWDTYFCTEESYNERFSKENGNWRSKGKNHTVTSEGHITRAYEKMLWTIEINNLEDLNKLNEKYGSLIIETPDYYNKTHSITIYDDYIE